MHGRAPRCRVFCAPRDGAAPWPSGALRAEPRANPRGGRVPHALPGRVPSARRLHGFPLSCAFFRGGRAGRRCPRCPRRGGGVGGERPLPGAPGRAGPTAGGPAAGSCCSLPRQTFLWKVAFIFFSCLGFTGKGQDESLRRAQSGTWGSRDGSRRPRRRGVLRPGPAFLRKSELLRQGKGTEPSWT